MPSDALMKWQNERCLALDSLEEVHGKVTGGQRGRQWATEHLNRALFVALSAEFQGFSRDLHEDGAIAIAEGLRVEPENAKVVPIVLDALVRSRAIGSGRQAKGRALDKGNVSTSALAEDFSILGIDFWADLKSQYPKRATKWNRALEDLNSVRNGIAHSDQGKIIAAQQQHGLTLRTFRKWRRSLDGAARGMDKVVGAYLNELTGSRPW